MSDSVLRKKSNKAAKSFGGFYLALAGISLIALMVTFAVVSRDLTFQTKLSVFLLIILFYLVVCAWLYIWQKRRLKTTSGDKTACAIFTEDIEAKLLALEEANRFFGASLKSTDTFRLVANRINEMIPFAVCLLFLAEDEKLKLKIALAEGENAHKFIGLETNFDKGLAGKTFQSKKGQIEQKLSSDKNIIAAAALEGVKSGAAVPVFNGVKAFGVLVLFGRKEFSENSLPLLEAIGIRIAPLLINSQAFETSLTNALTDPLTNLPNERAFYMVLENQIAESQRFRDERPLTILTIDIKNFAELNLQFGYATGDRILEYAALAIKNQLRQMDFLARVSGDEFFVVLPTASDQITQEIIERIKKAFVSKPFPVSEQETVNLQLNFGAASFGKDGETASNLLKHALLRKQQTKNSEDNKVLWFPKEYVN